MSTWDLLLCHCLRSESLSISIRQGVQVFVPIPPCPHISLTLGNLEEVKKQKDKMNGMTQKPKS